MNCFPSFQIIVGGNRVRETRLRDGERKYLHMVQIITSVSESGILGRSLKTLD